MYFGIGVSLITLASVVFAYIFGMPVPKELVYLALGSLGPLVGNLIPTSKERFEIVIPANYKGELEFRAREQGS